MPVKQTLKFPEPVWREVSKDEEWRISNLPNRYTLTYFNDTDWHMSIVGEQYGSMIGEPEGVKNFEEAKNYMYQTVCRSLEEKYEQAQRTIAEMQQYIEVE